MTDLSVREIQELLLPYMASPIGEEAAEKIRRYLAVFGVWSQRISLSTILTPVEVVQRHFGEGFALAEALPPFCSLLDLGSGAGFPGLPIALHYPGKEVVLAESQKKKASFLKEVSWEMKVPVSVWAARAEDLPTNRSFEVVALRAVDNMPGALVAAVRRLRSGGTLAFFVGEQEAIGLPQARWIGVRRVDIALSKGHVVLAQLANDVHVPRGTLL